MNGDVKVAKEYISLSLHSTTFTQAFGDCNDVKLTND